MTECLCTILPIHECGGKNWFDYRRRIELWQLDNWTMPNLSIPENRLAGRHMKLLKSDVSVMMISYYCHYKCQDYGDTITKISRRGSLHKLRLKTRVWVQFKPNKVEEMIDLNQPQDIAVCRGADGAWVGTVGRVCSECCVELCCGRSVGSWLVCVCCCLSALCNAVPAANLINLHAGAVGSLMGYRIVDFGSHVSLIPLLSTMIVKDISFTKMETSSKQDVHKTFVLHCTSSVVRHIAV